MTPIEVMLREAYFDSGIKTGFANQAEAVERYVKLEMSQLRQRYLAARAEIDDQRDTIRELRQIIQTMAQQAVEPTQVPETVTNSFAEDEWITQPKPIPLEG
jgi:hypothetical protein